MTLQKLQKQEYILQLILLELSLTFLYTSTVLHCIHNRRQAIMIYDTDYIRPNFTCFFILNLKQKRFRH
jgi:hypothetical protein